MADEEPPGQPEDAEEPEEAEEVEEVEDGESDDGDEASRSAGSEALRKALQNRRTKSEEEKEELTPEEQEELRKSAERLRRAIDPIANYLPKFTLPQMPQIGFSQDLIEKLTGATGFYDQIAKSLLPAIPVQDVWSKNLGIINSDLLKRFGATQLQMQPVLEQLNKRLDFGLPSGAKWAEQFASYQPAWFKDLESTLERLRVSPYPPNLREIEDLRWEEVEVVVIGDGIGLFATPRTSIAEALVRAETAAKRREILGRRWKAISEDCRTMVEACRTEAVSSYVASAVAAMDALDSGHSKAAQALTASLIDTMLTAYFGEDRKNFTPDRKGKRTTDAFYEVSFREFIAVAPMWQAYQQFRVEDGDRVPTTFNRHATAHTVHPQQFTRRNAVQALMFASGLICFFDDLALRVRS